MVTRIISKILSLGILFNCFSLSFAAFPPPVVADKAMVVTAQHIASQVGIDILKKGGNAIDAAVAIGYALAVVQPCCGNLGGGGFMLIHLAHGQNVFVDFREEAPAAIKADDFFDAAGKKKKTALYGYLSVGVPGTVMGLNTALEKYGRLPLKTVMAPAIELAKKGYRLEDGDICLLNFAAKSFSHESNVAQIFLHQGQLYQPGDWFVQKQLARTLTLISEKGSKAFYQGPIAKAIVSASKAHQGVLSLADFAHYSVQITRPISCDYHGYEVLTSPPPGSGVTVCEILNIVSGYSLSGLGFNSAFAIHDNVEAMRYAFADRNQYLGDPNFVHNPMSQLLSPAYAASIRAHILPTVAGNSKNMDRPLLDSAVEKPQTSAYVVADEDGNAVSVTYTLNGYFGSGVIAGDTGFFLNNEIDDFTLRAGVPNQFKLVQGNTNLIASHKRPLSSMSPTIVMKNNQPWLLISAAGGSSIITIITEIIENIIDWQMDINSAVNSARYHMQWLPDKVYVEPFGFSPDTMDRLQKMGYSLQLGSLFHTATWGQAVGILVDPHTHELSGAADYRHLDGTVLGIRSPHGIKQTCPPSQS